MFMNAYHHLLKSTRPSQTSVLTIIEVSLNKPRLARCISGSKREPLTTILDREEDSKELAITKAREILQKEFPEYFDGGKFASRIAYVDFIDHALSRLDDLGLNKDLNTYKELLRVFPPGKYHPPNRWEFGLFHAPQQLAATRVLNKLEMNNLKPDKDIEKLVVAAFSNKSSVWLKIARMNYWSMKGRNLDPNPLPEVLPNEPHQLAKLAIIRMSCDLKSIVSITNTSRIPDSIDKTWIVHSQSPSQKSIIERLSPNSTLYLEECGLTFVGDKYLSYFALKFYEDEETVKKKSEKPAPDYNFNTVKVKFYGKPIREKLKDSEAVHYFDGSYILALGITGTSSHDSLLSWLKILQQRNPNLRKLNVVFRMNRPTPELVETNHPASQSARN